MNGRMLRMAVRCMALLLALPATAQVAMQDMPMPEHRAHAKPDHAQPDHAKRSTNPPADHAAHAQAPAPGQPRPTRSAGMAGMHHAAPDAGPRSADYSDGYTYGAMTGMDMQDDAPHAALWLDRLEVVHARAGANAAAIDGEAWYGRNFDKLWLKFEGEHAGGRLQDMRAEALWAHAITPFWNTQLGVRHDFGVGPGRTWAAFGVEGLAPYWFETQATLYLGQGGRTAARVAFEYEARFTQRLILQPSLEANFLGRSDPQRAVGAGLSDADLGLRLRYEIRREFAPYVGIAWQQRFGRTRQLVRAQGEPAGELRFVAGLRVWF